MTSVKKLFAVTVLAAAVFCGLLPSEKAHAQVVGSQLVTLLPPNTTTLLGVDVDSLRNTGAYATIEARQSSESLARLDAFASLTGFDPRRDLDTLLVGVVREDGTGSARYVGAANGNFPVPRIEALFQMRGIKPREHRGFRIVDAGGQRRANRRQHSLSLVFLDSQRILFGEPELLIQAIDRSLDGGASLALDGALLRQAELLSPAHQLWAVSEQPSDLIDRATARRSGGERQKFLGVLTAMQSSTLAVDFNSGVHLEAVGSFESAEAARTLADAVRGLLAFAQLSRAGDQTMMPALRNLQVTDQDERLTLSVRLDQAELEELIDALDSRRGAGVAKLD